MGEQIGVRITFDQLTRAEANRAVAALRQAILERVGDAAVASIEKANADSQDAGEILVVSFAAATAAAVVTAIHAYAARWAGKRDRITVRTADGARIVATGDVARTLDVAALLRAVRPAGMSRNGILFLAANPHTTSPLALAEECAAIERELRMSPYRADFEFRSAWAVTVDELARHVMELSPTIIHFSGHGSRDGLPPEPPSQRSRDVGTADAIGRGGGIYVHGDRGEAQLVTPRALAMMIKSSANSVRVVVLNACYSDAHAESLSAVVDCVVGMAGAIGDEAARWFSAAFYCALGNRRSVQDAVQYAVSILAAKGCPEEHLPRCRTRDGIDPVVLTESAGQPADASAGQRRIDPAGAVSSRASQASARDNGSTEHDPRAIGRVRFEPGDEVPPAAARLVTNIEYARFAQAAPMLPSSVRERISFWTSPRHADDPVTDISYEDAMRYCDFAGGRLPNEQDFPASRDPGTNGTSVMLEWCDGGSRIAKQIRESATGAIRELRARAEPAATAGFRCLPVAKVEPVEWARIAAGRYLVGFDPRNDRMLDEYHLAPCQAAALRQRRPRRVEVDGFEIARTAVTNSQFWLFVREQPQHWPRHWMRSTRGTDEPFPARLRHVPVVNVSADAARHYCARADVSLPSWYEWEVAAGGGAAGGMYPWGPSYDAERCNGLEANRGEVTWVDALSDGDSPAGTRQMAGNIFEWATGSAAGEYELRGGSYMVPCRLWGMASVFRKEISSHSSSDVGFRVVRHRARSSVQC